jgi:hypothetical protein
MLSGALRISTKYEVAALREWCIQELRLRWPRDVETMGTNSLPHAAGNSINVILQFLALLTTLDAQKQ